MVPCCPRLTPQIPERASSHNWVPVYFSRILMYHLSPSTRLLSTLKPVSRSPCPICLWITHVFCLVHSCTFVSPWLIPSYPLGLIVIFFRKPSLPSSLPLLVALAVYLQNAEFSPSWCFVIHLSFILLSSKSKDQVWLARHSSIAYK